MQPVVPMAMSAQCVRREAVHCTRLLVCGHWRYLQWQHKHRLVPVTSVMVRREEGQAEVMRRVLQELVMVTVLVMVAVH